MLSYESLDTFCKVVIGKMSNSGVALVTPFLGQRWEHACLLLQGCYLSLADGPQSQVVFALLSLASFSLYSHLGTSPSFPEAPAKARGVH